MPLHTPQGLCGSAQAIFPKPEQEEAMTAALTWQGFMPDRRITRP